MKKPDYVSLGLYINGLSLQPGEVSTYRRMQLCIEEVYRSFRLRKKRTISRERLRQIESKALRKCRKQLRTRPELMAELESRMER